jgi:hypothetical protein
MSEINYDKIDNEVKILMGELQIERSKYQPKKKEYITTLIGIKAEFSLAELMDIYDKAKGMDRRYTYTPSFLEFLRQYEG